MPSPFPGMNPYLEHEDAWDNFHEQFPGVVVVKLEAQVGPNYFVKVDEQIYIHELPAVDRVGLSYVEIRDRRTRRLVTVIELLSPSNKQPGADRAQYERKRAQVLASHTHLVEIDLLRGWERMPILENVPCDYSILVSRYEQRPRADFWPIGLRERLPRIPIPLAGNDPKPFLDLQEILHQLYDSSGYAKFIYDADPEPPLAPVDAAWARALIQGSKNGAK